jgi:hypothetical protein
MTDPGGGFHSTQDADPTPLRSGDDRSEGEKGKFFVWTPDEIRAVLGEEADAFMKAYGVTPGGNFEGRNILEFVGDMEQRPALVEARRRLFEARKRRVHPGRDEKVLTSWNRLMLAAFAKAARRSIAMTIAMWPSETLISCSVNCDGRIVACCGRGNRARPNSTATWRTTATSLVTSASPFPGILALALRQPIVRHRPKCATGTAGQTLKPAPPESVSQAQEAVHEPRPGGLHMRIAGQRPTQVPDRHLGFDVQLSERPGH